MYVEGTTADEIFSRIHKRMVLGKKHLPVVAPEHLIAMKLFAAAHNPDRRLRDLADVREIVKNTDIAPETVRALFVKYGLEGDYDDTTR
jgi:hypothetical protein